VPSSDDENVRWSTRFGEGSTKIERSEVGPHPRRPKKASVSGASNRDRPKLMTRRASSILLSPDHAKGWDRSEDT